MTASKFCCEEFGHLVDPEQDFISVNSEGRFYITTLHDSVVNFCPFCGTKVSEPWYDQAEIDRINDELKGAGAQFTYLNRDQTNEILDYCVRDNPKRDTPDGRWSCYRIDVDGKWLWRDETTLVGDVRTMTTVHDEMQGSNFGARVTEDAIYVITKREPDDA